MVHTSFPITLHIINFTDIQLYIYDKCPHDELTIIMRRYMMRIAQTIAEKSGSLGLITGRITFKFGFVTGCFATKMVQQSSYGKIDVS